MGIKHTTSADGSFSSTGATEWNRDHNIVETGSTTTLTLGAVPDGKRLIRSGTTLIGETGGDSWAVLGSDTVTNTGTTLTTVTGLSFAIVSGVTYQFEYRVLTKCGNTATNTTVGLSIGLTFPAATVVAANVRIGSQGAAGTDSYFEGTINAASGSVTSTSLQAPAITTTNYSQVKGVIKPSANGNLTLLFASEVATTAGHILLAGTNGLLKRLG